MVERRQAAGVQRPQRVDARHQGRQQQRLDQPVVVDEVDSSLIVKRLGQQFFSPGAVLGFQHRQQLLVVELAGVVEVDLHVLAEGLVAVRHGVVQVAHRHDVAHLERFLLLHQELHHDLQRRALALEHARRRNQRLHQRRAERVDQAEHLPVVLVGQERIHHLLADLGRLLERRIQFLPCRLRCGA